MKRGWKIFWIVCAVCAGVGLVCCSIAFILGVTIEAIERRYPNGIGIVSKSSYQDYDYYDMDDIDDIDDTGDIDNIGNSKTVVCGTGKLDFTGVDAIDAYMWGGILEVDNDSTSSDVISIEADNIDKRLGLRCYMDGNELKLVTNKKVIGIRSKKAGKIVIHVPDNYQLKEVDLELVAGYLHIDDIHANELSVDVGAGEGIIESFTAAEVDLNCGAGSLTAAGTADAEVDIDCGVGEIAFTAGGKETDYNYDIDCGIGEIVCGESSYAGIGREKTISNNAAKHMDISCGIGNVAVNFSEM